MAPAHVVLTVHNGASYIREQIESLQKQTHEDWVLWVRDDGSDDETSSILRGMADTDGRIRLHPPDGERKGVTLGFSWLLERLPADARNVFCCDADDVWLPDKMELSLEALREAESQSVGPILVHTDLEVTDADLNTLSASLWHHLGIDPERVGLDHLVVQNVVTGPTILMNRDLVDRVLPIPRDLPHHDWWVALVASTFGRIIAIPRATVLYRRHGNNDTGEYSVGRSALGRMGRTAVHMRSRTQHLRLWLGVTARQAEIFLQRFEQELPASARRFLEDYAEIPRLGLLRRKVRVLRLRALPEHGLVRNVAVLLRA